MRRILPLVLTTCAGCGEELIEPGRMLLSSGHEPEVWSVEPAVTHGTISKEDDSGQSVEIEKFEPPLEAFSLGRGTTAHFVVTGNDAVDVARVRARSLLVSPAGFAGGSLPLFVSRTSSFARPPGELVTDPGDRPAQAMVEGRFVLLGGPGGQLDGYDLGAWLPVEPPPPLDCKKPPCEIRSLGVVGGSLTLAIGDDWAMWLDPLNGGTEDASRPAELSSWAEVSGGQSIVADDETVYIVGGTRGSVATSSVLHILEDGRLEVIMTSSLRAGAAAVWVSGRGLCLIGGGDAQAAGVELLADGSKAFVPLAYGADPVAGSGAVALDASRVLRIGGKEISGKSAPTVEISLGCGTGCQPEPAGEAFEGDRVRAFSLGEGRALVLGEIDGGESIAARFAQGKLEPLPLREPRRGAASLALPTGHVGVMGGSHLDGTPAKTLELFIE